MATFATLLHQHCVSHPPSLPMQFSHPKTAPCLAPWRSKVAATKQPFISLSSQRSLSFESIDFQPVMDCQQGGLHLLEAGAVQSFTISVNSCEFF
ncbi:hypothetical protein V6N13_140354 [Hibiscus sabdariffa]|uniref:Uncharacterized protein n=1 Tax=Hibiscus sabdariffa TaxID=183260 RepID=A0ABR2QAF1_9ROSI